MFSFKEMFINFLGHQGCFEGDYGYSSGQSITVHYLICRCRCQKVLSLMEASSLGNYFPRKLFPQEAPSLRSSIPRKLLPWEALLLGSSFPRKLFSQEAVFLGRYFPMKLLPQEVFFLGSSFPRKHFSKEALFLRSSFPKMLFFQETPSPPLLLTALNCTEAASRENAPLEMIYLAATKRLLARSSPNPTRRRRRRAEVSCATDLSQPPPV